MSSDNPNLILLERVATKCLPLLEELIFVGGSVVNLYKDSSSSEVEVRPTFDVDVVAHVESLMDYYELEERVKKLGFENCTEEGAPICRYQFEDLRLDLMPDDKSILGF